MRDLHLDVICVFYGIIKNAWSILESLRELKEDLQLNISWFITVGCVKNLNIIQCVTKPVTIGG